MRNTDAFDNFTALHLSGFMICTGYLKCLVEQNQKGRPLTPDEMQNIRREGEKEMMDFYFDLVNAFSKGQP